jgi:hypothetical protein
VRRIALALALVLALASPAFADDPGQKPKEAVGFFLLCLTAFPIATFLPGLAFHLVLRALAPRRMRSITSEVDQHVVRTFAFGLVDSGVLFLVFAATAQKAPPIAALVFLAWCALAFAGVHGIARSIGRRVLGADGPGSDLKELAVGWFVFCFVGWVPVVGWAYALVCLVRSVGAVVLQAFVAPDDAP